MKTMQQSESLTVGGPGLQSEKTKNQPWLVLLAFVNYLSHAPDIVQATSFQILMGLPLGFVFMKIIPEA